MTNFPKGFIWGASTSAYQVEGGITNNWSEWEKDTAAERTKNTGGYPWGVIPEALRKMAGDPKYRLSNMACDSFHRYQEDVSLMKQLGFNGYRFSIEWSRIFPKKDKPSEEGIEYYRKLIQELKKKGIEPILTCWHWTLPIWVRDEGGLMGKNIEEYFKTYFKILVKEFGKDIKYWITLNEPDVVSYTAYGSGEWPPQEKKIFKYLYLYYIRLVKIHCMGYDIIKNKYPHAMVGVAKQNASFEPYNNMILNRLASRISRFFANELYLNRVKSKLDFIGLNYYFHNKIGIKGIRNDDDKLSNAGWWMRPDCLYYALMDLRKYNLPIIITENGVADYKDEYREWWLDQSFNAMEKALGEGVDLRGYLHWSLLDNFEWAQGYYPQFGLVQVDRDTLRRKIRKSGFHYKALIRKNR